MELPDWIDFKCFIISRYLELAESIPAMVKPCFFWCVSTNTQHASQVYVCVHHFLISSPVDRLHKYCCIHLILKYFHTTFLPPERKCFSTTYFCGLFCGALSQTTKRRRLNGCPFMKNWKAFRRKWLWSNHGKISAFSVKNWGQPPRPNLLHISFEATWPPHFIDWVFILLVGTGNSRLAKDIAHYFKKYRKFVLTWYMYFPFTLISDDIAIHLSPE